MHSKVLYRVYVYYRVLYTGRVYCYDVCIPVTVALRRRSPKFKVRIIPIYWSVSEPSDFMLMDPQVQA